MNFAPFQINDKKSKDRPYENLIWSLLGSIAFHGLLLLFTRDTLHLFSWHPSQKESRLTVKLAHTKTASSITKANLPNSPPPTLAKTDKKNTASISDAPQIANTEGNSDNTFDPDEGYLPQAYVTQTATPESEIDLSSITSPIPGKFQMYIWINSLGQVTKVEPEESDTPSWLSGEVIDVFSNTRFIPARRNEKPVASIMHIEVVY